jgi:hypothetical protein
MDGDLGAWAAVKGDSFDRRLRDGWIWNKSWGYNNDDVTLILGAFRAGVKDEFDVRLGPIADRLIRS